MKRRPKDGTIADNLFPTETFEGFGPSLFRPLEEAVIGLKVRIEGDGYVEFEMDNTKFSLFERSKLPELIGREAGNAPCGEIGFIIDDVDREAERLKGLGVQITSGPMDRPWGERTLHIGDPDGNIIEFAQKLR